MVKLFLFVYFAG